MTTVVRPFLFAWHFLTAIPLSRLHHEPTGMELAASMSWYSTVGLLIGGTLAIADFALGRVFAPQVVNVLLILLLITLTRGLHQDGLADTLDALAGGQTPADRLSIMRDPRIGSLGAAGLFLSLLLRYASLMALPQSLRLPALVCMPAVGRWTMVMLAWMSPYARNEGGLAAPFREYLSPLHVCVATVVLVSALFLGFGLRGMVAIVGMGLAVVLAAHIACRTWFGGITGDTLGATNEITEILFILFLPAFSFIP